LLAFDDIVDAGTVNVTAKGVEGSVPHVSNGEIVSTNAFNLSLQSQVGPRVIHQVQQGNLHVVLFAVKATEEGNLLGTDLGAGVMGDLAEVLAGATDLLPCECLLHALM